MENIKFETGVPKKCMHCKMTPERMVEKYGMGWMVFGVPQTNIIFLQCPNCNGLMGNTKALSNTLRLKKKREEEARKVIPAEGAEIVQFGGK